MKIIDRYLISEVAGPFILAVGGFVVIGMADVVFTLVDHLINKQVPFIAIFKLLIYKIPSVMVIFFPMAVLFAVMLVMIRLAKDNEFTILRATGINVFRVLLPICIIAGLISILSYSNNELLVPWTNHQSNNIIRKALLKKPIPEVNENVFFKDQENRIFYIGKVSADGEYLNDIMIFEPEQEFPRVIIAPKAYQHEGSWQLSNGVIHNYQADGHLLQEAIFEKMLIRVNKDVRSFFANQKGPKEMSRGELKSKLIMLKQGGISARDLEIEYYLKLAMPIACFIFALIGCALCVVFVKTTRDWWSVIVASIIAALASGFYITLTAVFRALGRGGYISPFISAWGANLFFLIIAAGFVLKKANK
ncbi:MAG: LptF/LptG family permease [Candidatus Margulisiibacteriota bacterium]